METKNWYSLSDAATLISLATYPKEQDDARNEILRPRAVNEHLKALNTSAALHYASLAPAPVDPLDRLLGGNEVGILKSNLIKYAGDIGLTLFVDAMPEPEVIKSETDEWTDNELLEIFHKSNRKHSKGTIKKSQRALADEYGVSPARIVQLLNKAEILIEKANPKPVSFAFSYKPEIIKNGKRTK